MALLLLPFSHSSTMLFFVCPSFRSTKLLLPSHTVRRFPILVESEKILHYGTEEVVLSKFCKS